MTIGLKDLFYAKLTEKPDGSEEYGTPKRMAKAITVGLETTTAEATLFADDGLSETIKEFVSSKVTVNCDDLTAEIEAELLGKEITDEGLLISSGTDSPPLLALGFRARKKGNTYRHVWLQKGKFAPPKEDYKTKDAGIEFKTPTIEGTFMLNNKGVWKVDFIGSEDDEIAKDWYKEVKTAPSEA